METAGLAIGVVGLAGLFTSCVDCFDLVQRGRYLGRDYLILETKYTNQRLRLLTWGHACGLAHPRQGEDVGWDYWDENIRTAVSETLSRIASLFSDHRALRKRYGLLMDRSGANGGVPGPFNLGALASRFRATTFAVTDLGQTAVATARRSSLPRHRTVPAALRWAVDDKRKFAELVQHLKDFIDDLEALTTDLNVRQRQRELIEAEVRSISDLSELEVIEEARMGTLDPVADAASLRLCQIHDLDSKPVAAESTVEPAAASRSHQPLHSTSESLETADESDWDLVEPTIAPTTDPSDMHRQVIHRVSYHHGSGRDADRQWLVIDADAPLRDPAAMHLAGQRPLPSLNSYLDQNTHLSFLVINEYNCSHDTDGRRQVEPTDTCVYLVSDDLCSLLNSWPLKGQPAFVKGMELRAPHTWYSHNRELLTAPLPPSGSSVDQPPQTLSRSLVSAKALFCFIEECMGDIYKDLTDSLTNPGHISWHNLPLIFRPGDLVVQRLPDGHDDFRAFEQTGPPRVISVDEDGPGEVLEIPVARVFASDTRKPIFLGPHSLPIRRSLFSRGESEVALLSALPIAPLHLAHDCDKDYLVSRGKKAFEMARGLSLVVYQDQDPDSLNGEYIIDVALYEKQRRHPLETITPRKETSAEPEGRENLPDLYGTFAPPQPDALVDEDPAAATACDIRTYACMPHTLPGFHTLQHVWKQLLVRNIQYESQVHDNIDDPHARFDDKLVPDEVKRSLKRILEPMELKPSWRWYRRHRLVHDRAASSRITLAVQGDHQESVARIASRIAKRPLYRIRLSQDADDLDRVFEKAKALNANWGCIFLLEDMFEAYMEHTHPDSRIKHVLLPMTRFLETFNGISILLLPALNRAENSLEHVGPKIRQKLSNSYHIKAREIPEAIWEELWEECITSRLCSTDRLLDGEGLQRLKELAKLPMTWESIVSTVEAVVPQGTSASAIDWSLIMELALDQQKFKDPKLDEDLW